MAAGLFELEDIGDDESDPASAVASVASGAQKAQTMRAQPPPPSVEPAAVSRSPLSNDYERIVQQSNIAALKPRSATGDCDLLALLRLMDDELDLAAVEAKLVETIEAVRKARRV